MSQDNIAHYAAVLQDLKNERQELDSHIRWVEKRLFAMQGIEPTKTQASLARATSNTLYDRGESQPIVTEQKMVKAKRGARLPVRITDQIAEILTEHGEPLHAKEIVRRLLSVGRDTTVKSITGSMPQDARKRFENLGNNIWAIAEWTDELKNNFRPDKIRWVEFG